jgi:putative tryptophan/tyrosine transport system substrate-binding protein
VQFDRLKRREFIIRVSGAMALWPMFTQAQAAGPRRWRIGCVLPLSPETAKPLATALEQRLVELGYENGRNINLATRIVSPQPEIAERAITTLVPDIDILVVVSTIGAMAAKKVAPEMPTVFFSVAAPVEIGLVQSLVHPGGNMTGVTFEAAMEAYGRRLQILKEIVPRLVRVAVLRARGDAFVKIAMTSLERSAPQLGLTLSAFDVRSADDLDSAFIDMQRSEMEAVIVVAGALTYANARRISELALQAHLPSCHAVREAVIAGGLVSFGPDLVEMVRQAAVYVDKIMHGTKPADLPVLEPTRFDLYLNLKTAAALGLTIPPSLLATADEVIE